MGYISNQFHPDATNSANHVENLPHQSHHAIKIRVSVRHPHECCTQPDECCTHTDEWYTHPSEYYTHPHECYTPGRVFGTSSRVVDNPGWLVYSTWFPDLPRQRHHAIKTLHGRTWGRRKGQAITSTPPHPNPTPQPSTLAPTSANPTPEGCGS